MANITPNNLYLQSQGSTTLHIAQFNNVSSTNVWASGIQGIISVLVQPEGTFANGSDAGGAVTWTASSGTINFQVNTGAITASAWVVSGFGNK